MERRKEVLVVSSCVPRGDSIGLVGGILNSLAKLDKTMYHITLYDYNFFYKPNVQSRYPVDDYICIPFNWIHEVVKKIPRLRGWYAIYITRKYFGRIIKAKHYDYVIFHQVPSRVDLMLREAHECGSKIVFEPFGSDILRVRDETKESLRQSFAAVDAVVGRTMSNVLIATKEIYGVPKDKIFEQREVLSGVLQLKTIQGKLSREAMMDKLGIPKADYNIVCGYSARESHRHKQIIESLIQSKDVLPKNYQIIFPMTYGALLHHSTLKEYILELKRICNDAGLNVFFLTDFISKKQMAYLHLVTDLFIEIQPTDNGNAFMIEALYAGNTVITGRWLKYKRFEQFGVPYYLIDTPEELPSMLRKIFTKQVEKINVPKQLIDFFDIPDGYDPTVFWDNLFNTI